MVTFFKRYVHLLGWIFFQPPFWWRRWEDYLSYLIWWPSLHHYYLFTIHVPGSYYGKYLYICKTSFLVIIMYLGIKKFSCHYSMEEIRRLHIKRFLMAFFKIITGKYLIREFSDLLYNGGHGSTPLPAPGVGDNTVGTHVVTAASDGSV